MTTALAVQSEARVVTPDELALIKTTVAAGATDAELKLFLFDCARQGVHPLDKLIHFTKRSGKYTPITSIDFMRIRAADSGEMAGSDDPVFEAEFGTHGAEHPTHPKSASVTVYRMTQGQRFAYTATARWSEYKPEQNDFMWRKMPHTMLGKCAEALALRKGFPRQLAGLYAKEEMEQAETPAAGLLAATRRVDPNVGDSDARPSGAEAPQAAARASGSINTETGEELPLGFALIDDYKPDGDWHHITWGRDAQGGWTVYKTKLMKVANAARVAFNDRVPVRLHAKKFPYLDKVERLDGGMSKEALAATKWTPDELAEQGF
jgi:phage recombination protein Bet